MRWIFVRNAVNLVVNFCKKCGEKRWIIFFHRIHRNHRISYDNSQHSPHFLRKFTQKPRPGIYLFLSRAFSLESQMGSKSAIMLFPISIHNLKLLTYSSPFGIIKERTAFNQLWVSWVEWGTPMNLTWLPKFCSTEPDNKPGYNNVKTLSEKLYMRSW